jgi:hypothetical protein
MKVGVGSVEEVDVMTPSTLDHRDGVWLEGHAHEWVRVGLISPDQAESIKHFEHLDEPVAPQRLTIVAEVASYLGSVIAFAGGGAIVGRYWDELGTPVQLLSAFAIAAVGFAAGTWLVHLAEAGTERLGSFLWVVGAGGVAMAAAVTMHQIDPRDPAWFAVVIGLLVLTVGLGLWRNLNRPLQMLTAAGGLVALSAGVSNLLDVSVWVVGSITWVASTAFGVVAALDHVRPRLVALAVSAAGVMVGAFVLAGQSERTAALVSMASAAMIVSFALYDRSWPLVALGLIAFFIAMMAMMQTVLRGMAAQLVAVVIGLIVVAAVAMRAQRTSGTDSASSPDPR